MLNKGANTRNALHGLKPCERILPNREDNCYENHAE